MTTAFSSERRGSKSSNETDHILGYVREENLMEFNDDYRYGIDKKKVIILAMIDPQFPGPSL